MDKPEMRVQCTVEVRGEKIIQIKVETDNDFRASYKKLYVF